MVEVAFTPLPAHVRTARLVAVAVARRSGVAESLLDEVRLAVGEACSLAVEAHRQYCPAEPVKIELTDSDGRFEVVVTDSAPAGNAVPGPAAADAAAATGGAEPRAAVPDGAGEHGDAPAPGGAASAGSATDSTPQPANGHGGLQDGFGLAVIAELADDVRISRTPAGISVSMSWPSSGQQ